MFWKKKKNKDSKSTESKIEVDDSEVRGAFRVEPSASDPIKFKFLGKDINVTDISVTGISFADDDFKVGQKEKVAIALPGVGEKMSVEIEVVAIIKAKNLCGTRFNNLTEHQDDLLSLYLVKRQKEMRSG